VRIRVGEQEAEALARNVARIFDLVIRSGRDCLKKTDRVQTSIDMIAKRDMKEAGGTTTRCGLNACATNGWTRTGAMVPLETTRGALESRRIMISREETTGLVIVDIGMASPRATFLGAHLRLIDLTSDNPSRLSKAMYLRDRPFG
jgi:hypothetical protein